MRFHHKTEGVMARQSSSQTIDSLRTTARRLAKFADPDCDPADVAALKRIIENRIAAPEILQALARTAEDP
jgi:hypothetical protein